ncbi:hypothetical protein G7K_0768-t1 [Saitoella complicata NRRL Y-17804]|uniref:Uncharacterized protein n=1 Tax=Saitoella complicata (strain BCRC 22490 / CBS 7301 / JCM 7358 / NBRC 10748 / NRRL Y-17804) TaxID=698492 RepID=A0A0E9N9R8_SAICN|nr:hypothetical protein G7K_0768-t1 [Saitoella complicata NRRL Y-17804]
MGHHAVGTRDLSVEIDHNLTIARCLCRNLASRRAVGPALGDRDRGAELHVEYGTAIAKARQQQTLPQEYDPQLKCIPRIDNTSAYPAFRTSTTSMTKRYDITIKFDVPRLDQRKPIHPFPWYMLPFSTWQSPPVSDLAFFSHPKRNLETGVAINHTIGNARADALSRGTGQERGSGENTNTDKSPAQRTLTLSFSIQQPTTGAQRRGQVSSLVQYPSVHSLSFGNSVRYPQSLSQQCTPVVLLPLPPSWPSLRLLSLSPSCMLLCSD